MKSKAIIIIVFIVAINKVLLAQLSFPKGTELNLNTTNNFLYEETRIFFNTGKYSPNDYRWEKISDSLDKRWFVTACFNGDCKNDLLQSGSFMKDFGINDTTCFIAFHVETFDSTGVSVIKYNVYNKYDSSDKANLIFNISYSNFVGIDELKNNSISIFPNPVSSTITLQSNINLQNAEIKIINLLGETVLSFSKISNATLDVAALNTGIYFLQAKANNKFFTQKFIKQ